MPFLKQQQNTRELHWAHNGIDIIVVCQNGWIPVHRKILALRCQQFQSPQEIEINNNEAVSFIFFVYKIRRIFVFSMAMQLTTIISYAKLFVVYVDAD